MEAKKVLNAATDAQLKLLIQITFLVSVGSIPINKESFDNLTSAKKTRYVSVHFGSKLKTRKLLKSERKAQLDILFKLTSSFKSLLYR